MRSISIYLALWKRKKTQKTSVSFTNSSSWYFYSVVLLLDSVSALIKWSLCWNNFVRFRFLLRNSLLYECLVASSSEAKRDFFIFNYDRSVRQSNLLGLLLCGYTNDWRAISIEVWRRILLYKEDKTGQSIFIERDLKFNTIDNLVFKLLDWVHI